MLGKGLSLGQGLRANQGVIVNVTRIRSQWSARSQDQRHQAMAAKPKPQDQVRNGKHSHKTNTVGPRRQPCQAIAHFSSWQNNKPPQVCTYATQGSYDIHTLVHGRIKCTSILAIEVQTSSPQPKCCSRLACKEGILGIDAFIHGRPGHINTHIHINA